MMPGERGVGDDEGDVNGDDNDDADDDDEEEDFRLIAHTFLCPMNPICDIWCDFGLKTYKTEYNFHFHFFFCHPLSFMQGF